MYNKNGGQGLRAAYLRERAVPGASSARAAFGAGGASAEVDVVDREEIAADLVKHVREAGTREGPVSNAHESAKGTALIRVYTAARDASATVRVIAAWTTILLGESSHIGASSPSHQ
jgi:hypothetical protein